MLRQREHSALDNEHIYGSLWMLMAGVKLSSKRELRVRYTKVQNVWNENRKRSKQFDRKQFARIC